MFWQNVLAPFFVGRRVSDVAYNLLSSDTFKTWQFYVCSPNLCDHSDRPGWERTLDDGRCTSSAQCPIALLCSRRTCSYDILRPILHFIHLHKTSSNFTRFAELICSEMFAWIKRTERESREELRKKYKICYNVLWFALSASLKKIKSESVSPRDHHHIDIHMNMNIYI